MIFKLRIRLLVLLFLFCFFSTIVLAEEFSIPSPQEAVKLSEQSLNMGPLIKAMRADYTTSLSRKKLVSNYRHQLLKDGWKEQSGGGFIKQGYALLISYFSPPQKGAQNRFGIFLARRIKTGSASAMRKAKPDQLSFMPLYPSCVQLTLQDTNRGVLASYESNSQLSQVAFFYKANMLKYGWTLAQDSLVSVQPNNFAKTKKSSAANSALLVFTRGTQEKCSIKLVSAEIPSNLKNQDKTKKDVDAKSRSAASVKTNISIEYYAHK